MHLNANLCVWLFTVDSRDSGVSESHSRQSSEPFTGSSEEQDDYLSRNKETEFINVLTRNSERVNDVVDGNGYDEEWTTNGAAHNMDEDLRMQNLEEQIREQEVLGTQKH